MFQAKDPRETQPSGAAGRYKAKLLTFRRVEIISSFLSMTINNPYTYGEFESPMWIDMLIELLCEPKRCRSTRADIKAWLKNDCFEGLIEQVRQATAKLRLVLASSGSESPGSSFSMSSLGNIVPMDLSVNESSSGVGEDSDSTSDIYVPNLSPLDASGIMRNVTSEDLGSQGGANYLGLSFPRSEAMFSQEYPGEMAANQNQRDYAVGLPGNSFGQQLYPISHGENSEYAMHEEIWKPLIKDLRTHGTRHVMEETRSDYVFEGPRAVAPWLFTRQNLLSNSMEPEDAAFVQPNQIAYPVQVKTEVESDPECEYLDISYNRAATVAREAANLEQHQAPQYQFQEGFDWQMPMAVPSPQPNHESQDRNHFVMDQDGDHFVMGQNGGHFVMVQDEALDYSINKQVSVKSEVIPIMATSPLSPNYEDKSTQTLPVPNDQLSRKLTANFPNRSVKRLQ